MSEQHFEVVSFEPWKDGVVRIRIACDEPEGRVCHTFYARQEDYDDRVKERDTHAAEVARLREAGFELHRQIGVHEANAALLESDVARLTQAKDGAYRERNMLVCALTKVFPSWLARHPETDTEWENDWRWIIFVQLPTGQASWHIHDSERAMFDHLPVGMNSWDGHTNDEKYQRIAALTARKDGA